MTTVKHQTGAEKGPAGACFLCAHWPSWAGRADRLLLVRAANRLFLERVDSVDHIFELLRSLRRSWVQIANKLAETVNITFTQVRGMTVQIFRIVVSEDRLQRWGLAMAQIGLGLPQAEK